MSGERKEATDFLCLAVSPEGFICNEPPGHGGQDHIAWAADAVLGRRSVQKWPVRGGETNG